MATTQLSWRELARRVKAAGPGVAAIPPSPLSKLLFADTRAAWLWLVVRLYVGWQWFSAGFLKLTGRALPESAVVPPHSTSWIFTHHLGAQLRGFFLYALKNPDLQPWYANFLRHFALPNAGLFTYLVTFGECFVGLGMLLGGFTGIAAFFGVFMNLNYLYAGPVSINPILAVLSVFLMLAWRVAGYIGADRVLLPLLGTPWTGSLLAAPRSPRVAARRTGRMRRPQPIPGLRVRRNVIVPGTR